MAKFQWRELHAAYVNLDHRQDRNDRMKKELFRVGLTAARHPGVVTKDSSWNHPPYLKLFARTPGAIGCMISQMGVMRDAYTQGRGAMVFEDDLVFADDIKERLDYIQGFVNKVEPDTDVIFLGGTVHMNPPFWHGRPHNPDLAPFCNCDIGRDHDDTNDEHMVRVYGMFSTHAYIIPYEKIPKILSLLDSVTEVCYGIDHAFIMLEPQLKCFAFLPGCVKQIDNQSDIGSGVTLFSNFASLGAHWFSEQVNFINND